MSLDLRDIAKRLLRGEAIPIASTELKVERLKVCESCEWMTRFSRQCKLCGCFLDLKTSLVESTCPIDNW